MSEKIKYFKSNGIKYIVESYTSTGIMIHKNGDIGEPKSESYEISYYEFKCKFEEDELEIVGVSITDDSTLKKHIKDKQKEAKDNFNERYRLESIDKQEREAKQKEEREAKILEERKRKALAIKLASESDED